MIPVKRVEIVVEAVQVRQVVRLIEEAGIGGYTLTRNIAGHGHRGERDADGLSDAFENACFVVAAEPDQANRLVEALRPLLSEGGGMCLVSDALWVRH